MREGDGGAIDSDGGREKQEQIHSGNRSSRGKSASEYFYSTFTVIKCLILRMKVNVTEHNNHNGAIRWRISTSAKVIWQIFAKALTVSQILKFKICQLENVGQGHRVQHSQWSHSMTNINIYENHT